MDVQRTVWSLCEVFPLPVTQDTKSQAPPSKQVTRPAVAMVTSRNQSEDGGGWGVGGGFNPKDDSITPSISSAAHRQSLSLCNISATQDLIISLPFC